MAAIVKQLQHSMQKNRTLVSQNHFPCLTFVAPDGKPSTLTCPLRKIEAHGDGRIALHFGSWNQVLPTGSVACEACVYMPKTREQYRLRGELTQSGHGPSEHWVELLQDAAASRQFALVFPNSSVISAGGAPVDTRSNDASQPVLDASGKGYQTLTMDLLDVEYLCLKNPQRRSLWQRSDTQGAFAWEEMELNP